MANNKGSALSIIAFIIGAGGLGIGIFTMITSESEEPNVVALWETITRSGPTDDFILSFSSIQLNHSNYFSMSNGNTTITLTRSGWYKFTIRTMLIGLTTTDDYYFNIEKNGAFSNALLYTSNPPTISRCITAVAYVESDGNDEFIFRCFDIGADPFGVTPTQKYNQLALEFVE